MGLEISVGVRVRDFSSALLVRISQYLRDELQGARLGEVMVKVMG